MHNGLGPWWFPDAIRGALTRLGSTFFNEASWGKHDEGYGAGRPCRAECDRKFLQAMLRDATIAETTARTLACILFALFLWAAVRIFGVFSYNRN